MNGNVLGELWHRLSAYGLDRWRAAGIPERAERNLVEGHGDLARWHQALAGLPALDPSRVELDAPVVRVGAASDVDETGRARLAAALDALHPWRKGPFELFGIRIDAEWRSDLKWARLAGAIAPLDGRRVLDVGCGNGYYAWRMRGAGAAAVIGVDPGRLHVMQALAVRRYLPNEPVWLLPLAYEDLPRGSGEFDTVFSMGVIYHRRDPHGHLAGLHAHLRPGGEAVVESIVVPGDAATVIEPTGRYARMRNVWAVPSAARLTRWLEQAGFEAPRVIDETRTTGEEQRSTPWMRYHSLAEALDPADASRTVEGWPAPRRAIVLARRSAQG